MNVQALKTSAKIAGAIAGSLAIPVLADNAIRGGGQRSLDAVRAEAQEAANAPRGKLSAIALALQEADPAATAGRVLAGAANAGWSQVPKFDTGAFYNSLNRVI